MKPKFLDTTAALEKFLSDLGNCDGQPPRFYCWSRGTLSRSSSIFNDSDALFVLYEIRVAGIEDLQLMELASRNFTKKNVNGLARCIERDSTIPLVETQRWQVVKDNGKHLFDAQQDGSYAVFDQRLLSKDIKEYCTQDVTFMPHLRDVYRMELCDAWWRKIEEGTDGRIQLSQSPTFRGKGQHMTQGPPAWLSWHPTTAEKLSHTLFKPAPAREQVRTHSPSLFGHSVVQSLSDNGDELANMLCDVTLTKTKKVLDEDSDDDFVHRWNSTQDFHSDDSREDPDFTACDKEFGYCGRCEYYHRIG
ncbi:hypothetical protein LTR82_018008 [Friedmanniomyces endolithicus]|uniref:Uncharacterized protein n=1 Tax=Friedmanniomyces endolithicus TaxID=329885 RepID=A0AAN6F5E4_9PEZI|nr:hypothetical protein LTR82_018008 [Friedmanniomyces endolithicus]